MDTSLITGDAKIFLESHLPDFIGLYLDINKAQNQGTVKYDDASREVKFADGSSFNMSIIWDKA